MFSCKISKLVMILRLVFTNRDCNNCFHSHSIKTFLTKVFEIVDCQRSTCNAFITIWFIFAAGQTGSVKWITRLIDTEWTAWILAVFSVRFVTCYKITSLHTIFRKVRFFLDSERMSHQILDCRIIYSIFILDIVFSSFFQINTNSTVWFSPTSITTTSAVCVFACPAVGGTNT